MTSQGSFGHRLWETGDRPEGYEEVNSLVDKLDASWKIAVEAFREPGSDITISHEVRLGDDNLNFGTMDKLVLNKPITSALVGDGKFGNWGVPEARENLQGINYALLVIKNFPTVQSVWVWFGNPRREEYTRAIFTRRQLLEYWYPAIQAIITKAQNPNPKDFRYDPVNCSFCSRLDCAARLAVATSYPTDSPKSMTIEELQKLKVLSNSLKTLIKGIDDEAKKRVLDDGEEMEGYEPRERVRRRVIYGKDKISLAIHYAEDFLGAAASNAEENAELSFSSLESLFVNFYGDKRTATPYIERLRKTLEDNNLLTTEKFFYVAAKH
jgi:hypothetical protein